MTPHLHAIASGVVAVPASTQRLWAWWTMCACRVRAPTGNSSIVGRRTQIILLRAVAELPGQSDAS